MNREMQGALRVSHVKEKNSGSGIRGDIMQLVKYTSEESL